MKKNLKGFTLIEVLIVALVVATAGIILIERMVKETDYSFNLEKKIYSQNVAWNYMERIDNIRGTSWVKAFTTSANDIIDRTNCSSKISTLTNNDVSTVLKSDLFGWFCIDVPGSSGDVFSDLNGSFSLSKNILPLTQEEEFVLNPVSPGSIGNVEYFNRLNKEIVKDFENTSKITSLLNRTPVELSRVNQYIGNDKPIPQHYFLVTITFSDAKESDLDGFTVDEKEFYRGQIKRVTIKVEYSEKDGTRKNTTVERVFTNFRI